jgi:tRNA pseudouridine13 synthase
MERLEAHGLRPRKGLCPDAIVGFLPSDSSMKVKCQPDDFRVEELTLARPVNSGRYTFYRLCKRDLGTIEAVEAICRRWNLPGRRVSFAGLKDRHASTSQYLTILDGPAQSLDGKGFVLEPVGRLAHPYTPRDLRGNRFELVLRGLSEFELTRARAELAVIPRDGLPNYFDDQRFGSVGLSGEFIACAWLRGEFERALWLALAEANSFDRRLAKADKTLIRAHWGDWAELKARLPRSGARSIVTYLVDHPTDFRGAFARLRRELRSLYFSAFQSHLWNLVLARWLESILRPDQVIAVDLKAGRFPFPRRMDPEQLGAAASLSLPLPSSRSELPGGVLGELIQKTLEPFRLGWADLRVRHLKDLFFSKGTRPCLFIPQRLESRPIADELYPGRVGLHLVFELEKGSYATILVKRLTEAAGAPE